MPASRARMYSRNHPMNNASTTRTSSPVGSRAVGIAGWPLRYYDFATGKFGTPSSVEESGGEREVAESNVAASTQGWTAGWASAAVGRTADVARDGAQLAHQLAQDTVVVHARPGASSSSWASAARGVSITRCPSSRRRARGRRASPATSWPTCRSRLVPPQHGGSLRRVSVRSTAS
jgi:hypothetical protein